jgi:serine/threonine protein kinase
LDSTNSSNTNLSSDSSLFHQTFFKPEFKHVRRDSSASNFSASSADSGAKSVLNTAPLMANKFVGTPDYLSPESILGIGQDASVDWVLFVLLIS